MKNSELVREAYKQIPSVDDILSKYSDELKSIPHSLVLNSIRKILNEIRNLIKDFKLTSDIPNYTYNKIQSTISELSVPNLKRVINGTGIILHTGLGRSPLSKNLVKKAIENITPYSNLELDLPSGKRGERNKHVEPLINSLTGSEAAIVVNNNAAAVLLMLNALSEGKEVIVSRGEQVEIGGSFRIPDVIKKSGCKMIEVGTTNKTHIEDYSNAINDNTGAILVAHTSNYKVMGFTASVDLKDLSALAKKKRVPLMLDLGCGAVADFNKLDLPKKSPVRSYLSSGASVVCFSGDKLLGGPQSGIICGKKSLVNKIHKNPLYRAFRSDKFSFAVLEAVLRTYITDIEIQDENLAMSLFKRNQENIKKLASKIIKNVPRKIQKKYGMEIINTEVEAGSGSLPLEKIKSVGIIFKGDFKASDLSKQFRYAKFPLLGYIKGKHFHIDLKAISPYQEKELICSLEEVLK